MVVETADLMVVGKVPLTAESRAFALDFQWVAAKVVLKAAQSVVHLEFSMAESLENLKVQMKVVERELHLVVLLVDY